VGGRVQYIEPKSLNSNSKWEMEDSTNWATSLKLVAHSNYLPTLVLAQPAVEERRRISPGGKDNKPPENQAG
jgi:hypothetical protein